MSAENAELTEQLQAVLSNPNALAKLAEVAKNLAQPTIAPVSQNTEKVPTSPVPVGANVRHGLSEKANLNPSIALLQALRPYLSPHRRELLDRMIKMSGFMELATQLKRLR